MATRTCVDVRIPLVNENLEETGDAKGIIEQISDEDLLYDLHIHVTDVKMIPTALALSMSKRGNVDYYAHVSPFPGSEYVIGYLKSTYFKEVSVL